MRSTSRHQHLTSTKRPHGRTTFGSIGSVLRSNRPTHVCCTYYTSQNQTQLRRPPSPLPTDTTSRLPVSDLDPMTLGERGSLHRKLVDPTFYRPAPVSVTPQQRASARNKLRCEPQCKRRAELRSVNSFIAAKQPHATVVIQWEPSSKLRCYELAKAATSSSLFGTNVQLSC